MLINDSFAKVKWVPLKISSVEYPKGDIIGKVLALLSLSPLGVLSAFVALIIFRRDLHTITLFIGLLINILSSIILKRIIAEPRPISRSVDTLYTEYGMPSSHAQFMWCLSIYMFFFLFYRTNYVKKDITSYFWKILTGLTFFVWAILVSFSRVYLRYHTIEQVCCGVVTGTVFAIVWFYLTQKISETLLIRDTTLIPNILWFEYTSTRQEVRSRRRKSDSRKSQ